MPIIDPCSTNTRQETHCGLTRPVLGLLATNVPIPRSPTDVAGLKNKSSLFPSGTFLSGSLLTSSTTTSETDPDGHASVIATADSPSDLKLATQPELAWGEVDVILAEDEPIYVDIVKAGLAEQGILAGGVLAAEDGLKAMELLLASQSGLEDRPLLLLLDIRMPHMDGRECATRAREMADRGMLRRPPFVVGYSADASSVPRERDSLWPFDALLSKEALSPKSAEDDTLVTCLQAFQKWWAGLPNGDSKRWRLFDLAATDCVIADDWPICRMNVTMALARLGMLAGRIHEADDGDEAAETIAGLVTSKDSLEASNPLLVILDQQMPQMTGSQCAANVRGLVNNAVKDSTQQHPRREPFLVCISAGDAATSFSQQDKEVFHCFLPKSFTPDDLRWVLELFRLWWLGRYASKGCTQGSADDLSVAMQAWRERRERRRCKRQQLGGGSHPRNYGAQIRLRAATRRLSAKELNTVLQEEWPGEFFYPVDGPIGRGSQADVYKGKWRVPGSSQISPVAIKVVCHVATPGEDGVQEFVREREIGRAFHSPHLVKILAGSPSWPPIIIQEYCAGGSLHDLLHGEHSAPVRPTTSLSSSTDVDEVPTMKQRLKIALDVARGMQCLHEAEPPVMHRDLKSANVLLVAPLKSSKDVPVAKVADFGLARAVLDDTSRDCYLTKAAGTLRWMAPEVMCSGSYDTRADIYSYGSLLFELLTLTFPYGEKPFLPRTLEEFLAEGGRPDMMASGSVSEKLFSAPSWILTLMREAWSQNPDDRPTFAMIVKKFEEHLSL